MGERERKHKSIGDKDTHKKLANIKSAGSCQVKII